jgi:hypothetical protein
VAAPVTYSVRQCRIVPIMVTQRRRPPPKPQPRRRRPFYLKEWRKFMGTKAVEIAFALDIERESYYRLEKNWWTINAGEMDIIANTVGIKPSQLWFPPPAPGQDVVSLDDMVEDMPEHLQKAAINAVRGIAGR